jgi:hypothetical protein
MIGECTDAIEPPRCKVVQRSGRRSSRRVSAAPRLLTLPDPPASSGSRKAPASWSRATSESVGPNRCILRCVSLSVARVRAEEGGRGRLG